MTIQISLPSELLAGMPAGWRAAAREIKTIPAVTESDRRDKSGALTDWGFRPARGLGHCAAAREMNHDPRAHRAISGWFDFRGLWYEFVTIFPMRRRRRGDRRIPFNPPPVHERGGRGHCRGLPAAPAPRQTGS